MKERGTQIYNVNNIDYQQSESTQKVVGKMNESPIVQQMKGGLTSSWGWMTNKISTIAGGPKQEVS